MHRSALHFNMDVARDIAEIINAAQAPALLCSWGKDSSLLLYYARRVKPDIAVYFFGDTLPTLAAEMVVNESLAVWSFAPRWSYVKQNTLVDEYSFNDFPVHMLSEIATTADCRHGHLELSAAEFSFPHDVILWGYRRTDSHPLLPGVKFDREIHLGHTRFVAPLYDLTTDQVLNALDALGLEYAEDEPVEICDDCMKALTSNATTLAGFQERPLNH